MIQEYLFRLKISFENIADSDKYLSWEDFIKILDDYRVFDESQLKAIVNPICLPFTK